MNEKLKQRQLGWLREDRLTRDVCPNVSTRDWVPCYLYRQPLNAKLKPFRTAFLWAANSPGPGFSPPKAIYPPGSVGFIPLGLHGRLRWAILFTSRPHASPWSGIFRSYC
jgi:hypothetical protein